jgi:hypothetical protein
MEAGKPSEGRHVMQHERKLIAAKKYVRCRFVIETIIPDENQEVILQRPEWGGRELPGEVEAATLSDPERACLSV